MKSWQGGVLVLLAVFAGGSCFLEDVICSHSDVQHCVDWYDECVNPFWPNGKVYCECVEELTKCMSTSKCHFMRASTLVNVTFQHECLPGNKFELTAIEHPLVLDRWVNWTHTWVEQRSENIDAGGL